MIFQRYFRFSILIFILFALSEVKILASAENILIEIGISSREQKIYVQNGHQPQEASDLITLLSMNDEMTFDISRYDPLREVWTIRVANSEGKLEFAGIIFSEENDEFISYRNSDISYFVHPIFRNSKIAKISLKWFMKYLFTRNENPHSRLVLKIPEKNIVSSQIASSSGFVNLERREAVAKKGRDYIYGFHYALLSPKLAFEFGYTSGEKDHPIYIE